MCEIWGRCVSLGTADDWYAAGCRLLRIRIMLLSPVLQMEVPTLPPGGASLELLACRVVRHMTYC